ncbi:alpha-2B adrenergic receptor-like [Pecten maximus]|uniref:alpha-2B adrenergic receptor-like n=1 Tax=Pecten maximus TaxID=6579 RepID=UPI0014585961|nr:alpha-2B adrenergic receptor-like [Pecten maximus]XP_033727277.1 alpha-2B adrenergic receptor-like [Pecten maximus]XP_033727278.1 alpha-2B adrenergic receptor-like [Pecten maximus]
MPMEISDLINFYTFDSAATCRALRFINYFSCIGSGTTLIAIAVDRFRKICKPFEAQITEKMARWIIFGVIVFALFCSWPAIFLNTVIQKNLTEDTSVVARDCTLNPDEDYILFVTVYNSYLFLCFIIVFIVLTVLYTLVGRQLYKLRSFRFYATGIERNLSSARPTSSMTVASDVTHSEGRGKMDDSSGFGNDLRDGALSPIGEDDYGRPTSANSIAVSARSLKMGPHKIIPQMIDPDHKKDIVSGMSSSVRQTKSFTEKSGTDKIPENNRRVSSATMANSKERAMGHKFGSPLREGSATSRLSFASTTSSMTDIETRDSLATGHMDNQKEKMRSQNINTKRYTIIALSISIAFVLSFLPYLTLVIWSTLFITYDPNDFTPAQLVASELFHRSFLFNCALNPIIYGFLNTEFKKMVFGQCARVLCCCCKSRHKDGDITNAELSGMSRST